MRVLFACLTLLPTAALADVFTLRSEPQAVTVYPYLATVHRQATVTLPQGSHQIVLPDLPHTMDRKFLRVSVTGATLGTTQFRKEAVPPQADTDSAEILAAKEQINAAEAALRGLDDQIEAVSLAGRAAQAQIGFLGDLGRNEGLPADVSTLQALGQMIGAESLQAEQEALRARQAARDLDLGRKDLENTLRDARAALEALTPPPEKHAQLTLDVMATAAGEVMIGLEYLVDADWLPTYDIHLDGKDAPQLSIKRGAVVSQRSGENWQGVALTLSTLAPSGQTQPSQVYPRRLTLADKEPPRAKLSRQMADSAESFADPVIEAPVIVEEAKGMTNFDGPGVRYDFATPVSIASGVDDSRVALDTLTFPARRFARAVPRSDQTAFLMAEFTNTTQEPLLPADEVALFLDNTLIGQMNLGLIPAGDEAELPFGPIEDLRLTYTVLDQTEGDRGIISRSNAKTDRTRMDIQNIGSEDWQVEVRAAVPYTAQEDLQIDWTANPVPDETNLDDRRGILQWDLNVAAGATTSVTIEENLRWPEDKILR
ncbi:mucoidy inhibitor MuiA family protein [Sulfitobacter mediterraneus]|uniref:mucoidy inhibitor MuiA family protein n=1 Tax=Sulfitobacter mediterraneus TaxID=83219 RepID=UPI001932E652|nr:mucoidy inhibitor MuiA family protein [Sulfitobacter mediterraneus]MBM1632718.1 mucoidy inhibitor MuiA family protein [Sulfitobacter mediterraneus]MBM1641148.1 mucoidy inhibitor MuiA family protein [Sulfitobacter mediterraneus]MBM1644583.1 mucoidy inhibitor MuiA family protein [Sulfitobacter mediterraneus]MBM1649268.1 mucoidy inhibitor MuiA family protein [Sulfitobacter mediterraneus]MBM1653289.1 mucoidy inhibitor MuiA family protein [Sulfitobacter mediterraneus]